MLRSRRWFLAASSALALAPDAALAQAPQRVSIGTSPIDGAMGLIAAQRAGFFQHYGLDAQLTIATGAANAAAVAGGTMQFAGSNLVTLIKAHLHGLPFQIVAPGAAYSSKNPTQVLVVPKRTAIRTAADLSGKTIATTSLGDILAASTLAWIDQHGGTSATVKMVELPPPAIAAAIENGHVDAATLAEPYLSEALSSGEVTVFADIFDAIAANFMESAYFAMPDFIDKNHDAVQKFARAILDGNAFANNHPDQTAPWLVDSAKVDLAAVKRSRREMFSTSMQPAQIQVVIDALVRMKAIDHGFPAIEMMSPVTATLR